MALREKALKILKTSVLDFDSNGIGGVIKNIFKDGIAVATTQGTILIQELKPEGKPKMDAYAWTNGVKLQIGAKFL